jgi:hypothetical protein
MLKTGQFGSRRLGESVVFKRIGGAAVPRSPKIEPAQAHSFGWTKVLAGRKVKAMKPAEWATASHVEKHTSVPHAKPATTPAK